MERVNHREYLSGLWRVFREKYAVWFFLTTFGVYLFHQYFAVAWSITDSLPQRVFWVVKNQRNLADFRQGDYVYFNWQGGIYPKGTPFTKMIVGLPGDTVVREGRDFFVNGKFAGTAKTRSRQGEPLEVNRFSGRIPPNYFWVYAPHRDSLDSRYEITGLIHSGQIMGKAHPVF